MFKECFYVDIAKNRKSTYSGSKQFETMMVLLKECLVKVLKMLILIKKNCSLFVPKSRTSLYSCLFSCSASRLWNALPQCVREASILDSLKKKIKNNL